MVLKCTHVAITKPVPSNCRTAAQKKKPCIVFQCLQGSNTVWAYIEHKNTPKGVFHSRLQAERTSEEKRRIGEALAKGETQKMSSFLPP